jgi:hypothetical protein
MGSYRDGCGSRKEDEKSEEISPETEHITLVQGELG